MPFNMGAPLPGGVQVPYLFDYDFRQHTPGPISAAALLAATAAWGSNVRGLTFTRSTVSTVQTSASTINATPGANDACVGNRDSAYAHRGLVIENRQQNTIPGGGRSFIGSGWSYNQNSFYGGLTVPTATTGQVGPDGTSNATLIVGTKWGIVNNGVGQSGKRTFSAWQSGSSMMLIENAASSGPNQPGTVLASISGGFKRYAVTEGATHTIQFSIADGRDETSFGGPGESAFGATVDFAQLQYGTFATEAIVAGTVSAAGIAREDDRLSYGVGSELVSSDGMLRCRLTFSPKFATTEQVNYAISGTSSNTTTAYWWLLSWGATLDDNYVRIKDADKKLYVKIAGTTEVVSTNAIAWSRFDEVTIEIEIGSGLTSVARYKLNGGAWVSLALGAVSGVPAPGATPIAIMRDINAPSRVSPASDDRGQPPCWLHRVTFYNKTPAVPQLLISQEGEVFVTDTGQPIITNV